MPLLSLVLPEVGKPDRTEDPKVTTALVAIQTVINAGIGAWTTITLGAKVEAGSLQLPAARVEGNSAVARLRGRPQVKAGEELKAGETLGTISAGLRPPSIVEATGVVSSGASLRVIIAATGVITLGAAMAAEVHVTLDSLTYNLN
jgi:hypothetical protein